MKSQQPDQAKSQGPEPKVQAATPEAAQMLAWWPGLTSARRGPVQPNDLPQHPTSRPLRQAVVLQMQQRFGNAHVQRLLSQNSQRGQGQPAAPVKSLVRRPPARDRKEASDEPGDPYEQEAEQVAERVMRFPAASPPPPPDDEQNGRPASTRRDNTQQPIPTTETQINGATAGTLINPLQANAPTPTAPDKEAVAPEENTFANETTPDGELKEGVSAAGDITPAEKDAKTTAPEKVDAGATREQASADKGQDKEEKVEGESDKGTTQADTEKAPTSPGKDPAFQGVVSRGKHVAFQQGHNNPAQQKAMAAQAAAKGPSNEVASQAGAAQVGKMNAQEPQPFDKKSFKAQLLAKIEEITPKTQEDVEEFKSSNKAASLKETVTSSVKEGQEKAQGPIEETAKAAPDSNAGKPKAVTPLPPNEPGPAPADIGADLAAPKPKSDSEISLDKESQSLDQQMAEANVTEEQLEKSNEPEFQSALTSKKDAQKHAQEAPVAYRQDEQNLLGDAKAEAVSLTTAKTAEMHGIRKDQFGKITTSQTTTKSEDEKKRAEVAKNIEDIYRKTKQKVETRLNKLDTEVSEIFDAGAEKARQNLENHVEESKTLLAEILQAVGLSDEIQQAITEARNNYVAEMDRVIDSVANAVEIGLTDAKAIIATGQREIANYVAGLPQDLKQVGEKAATEIQGKFDTLRQQVDEKKNQLVDSLAQKYVTNLKEVDERVQQLREENKSWIDKAKDAVGDVIDTIKKLKTMLLNTLSRAAGAIDKIIKDPIGFLGNLIAGVKQGLQNFVNNIGSHLKKGLMSWLFGEAAKAGIQMPETFDLKGILSLALQLLGISWANLRARAVKMFGEKVVAGLEKAWEVFQIIQAQGIGGLWEYIKEQLSNLKEMVIDGIKNMVITEVIKAGIQWLIGVLGGPAGAFIKACKAIYDIIIWFINNGSRLMSLVEAIISSVSAIAAGNVSGAAKFIENSLAQAIPVVIGFLASLLGLGSLSEKIKGIIQKIQEPVNKAIDWVLGKAKAAVKKVASLLGFGKKGKPAEGGSPEANKKAREKARERVARATQRPFKDEKELAGVVKQIETDLIPEGLKSLNVTPRKDEAGKYDIVALASNGEDVGDAQVTGAAGLPFSVGDVVAVWWERRGHWAAATVLDTGVDLGGKPHVRFSIKVTKREGQEHGLASETIFIAVDQIEAAKGQKWRERVEGTEEDPAARRVPIRADVKEVVKQRAPKTADGDFIDPNSKKVIPKAGPFHFGHRPGFEWWKTRDRARAEKWTRERVVEHENNPDIYQIEDPGTNVSHEYEAD